jgi:UDPglucose 6-dehydrogenase
MRVSSIGLGKLGLCSAVCFASKGHHVIGVDSDKQHIDALNRDRCPIDEPGLPDLLNGCRHDMAFTTDYHYAVENSDVTLILVPTPSNADGRFSNACVESVLEQIAPALKTKHGFHVVDIISTVMPGSCETVFRPMLEERTGKVCGRDFGLVYNPEFVALGSVIRDFLHPDVVLIGASDDRSAKIVETLYASTVSNDPHRAVMSLTNAEITKLSLNCFVTMKISFANELTNVCERIPDADVDVVTAAIGADTRVGRMYLRGGLGFGGPCFPRDNLAFQRCAEDAGTDVHLSPRVVTVNREVVDRLFSTISEYAPPGSSVALLGLSYKPGTHIVEEAQPVMLAEMLLEEGYEVRMHDPKATPSAAEALGGRGVYCRDVYDAVSGATVVVMLMNWPEYDHLEVETLEERAGSSPLLVDCWRRYRDWPWRKFEYRGLGIGTQLAERGTHGSRPDIRYQDHRRRTPILGRSTVQHPALT